jgi:hypothetical protein
MAGQGAEKLAAPGCELGADGEKRLFSDDKVRLVTFLVFIYFMQR